MTSKKRKSVKLEVVESLKCPECGEIVNQCEYCQDYLVINDNAYCDGFDHMCKQCYEELEEKYKELEK